MRIQRAPVIPYGGTAYVEREPGEEPVLWVDDLLITEEQVPALSRRIDAQPDLLAALGITA